MPSTTKSDYTSDAHYEAMARIESAVYPLYPDTAERMKRHDKKWPEKYHRYRVVVTEDATDTIVAVGTAKHSIDTYHPHKFYVDAAVDPAFDDTQLRPMLYSYLVEQLQPLDPIQLSGSCNSAQPHLIAFYESRGYEMKTREYSSKLMLREFDPATFQTYGERVSASGVRLLNLHEMEATYPDRWIRMVYDIAMEVDIDVPWHEPIQPEPYEQWRKRFSDQLSRVDDAYLIALDGDKPIGVTMMFASGASSEVLFTGLTGVVRSRRRQGIAMALKVRSLSVAKEKFCKDDLQPYLMAENEENNPMFTINERLGFVRQPDWLNWVKELK